VPPSFVVRRVQRQRRHQQRRCRYDPRRSAAAATATATITVRTTADVEKRNRDLFPWPDDELIPPVILLPKHVSFDSPWKPSSSLVIRPLVNVVYDAELLAVVFDTHVCDIACWIAQCEPVSHVCVCVYVCVCARACVCACVRVRVRVRVLSNQGHGESARLQNGVHKERELRTPRTLT
jgi:hypothetical protein